MKCLINFSVISGVFDGLPSVTYLNLEANQIAEIPAGIFNQLFSLEFLNLGGNIFTELKEGTIPFFTNSESYFLGDALEKIEADAMFDGKHKKVANPKIQIESSDRTFRNQKSNFRKFRSNFPAEIEIFLAF